MPEKKIKIQCYLSLNCDTEEPLRHNILKALEEEGLKAELSFYRIDEQQAMELGLRGSPSILIQGQPVQPTEITGFT